MQYGKHFRVNRRDNKYTLLLVLYVTGRAMEILWGISWKAAAVVTESDQDMMATVAHEIAHCYEIGDNTGGSINESKPGSLWYGRY